MAAVLILTVIPASIKVGQPVVEHACFLITQKLLETGEVIYMPVMILVAERSVGVINRGPLRQNADNSIHRWEPDTPSMCAIIDPRLD